MDVFLKNETLVNIGRNVCRGPACQICFVDKSPEKAGIFDTLFRRVTALAAQFCLGNGNCQGQPPRKGFTNREFKVNLHPMSLATQTAQPPAIASLLLDKARRLGLSLPLDLERLAVMRGCDYYGRDLDPRVPPLGEVPLSNAELAIALIAPSLSPAAREIRLAAALLGARDVQADEAAVLAVQENCAETVRHIALCGRCFEPENSFWQTLLDRLPDVEIDAGKFPHPTRFVEMTGIDRGKVGVFTRWIRPRRPVAA